MAQRDLFGSETSTTAAKEGAATRGKPRVRTVARDQLGLEVVDLESLLPETIARYSILTEHKHLFAAKYVTYLPTEEERRRELERDRRIAEAIVSDANVDASRTERPAKPRQPPRTKSPRR